MECLVRPKATWSGGQAIWSSQSNGASGHIEHGVGLTPTPEYLGRSDEQLASDRPHIMCAGTIRRTGKPGVDSDEQLAPDRLHNMHAGTIRRTGKPGVDPDEQLAPDRPRSMHAGTIRRTGKPGVDPDEQLAPDRPRCLRAGTIRRTGKPGVDAIASVAVAALSRVSPNSYLPKLEQCFGESCEKT
jgi:hypothetical protein